MLATEEHLETLMSIERFGIIEITGRKPNGEGGGEYMEGVIVDEFCMLLAAAKAAQDTSVSKPHT
jgi:hypothetical protein